MDLSKYNIRNLVTFVPFSERGDWKSYITSLRFTTMFCGTDNILQNTPHIQNVCEKYVASHYT